MSENRSLHAAQPLSPGFMFIPGAVLLVKCDVIVAERDVVAHLLLVELPIRVALQYLGEMYTNVARGLPKSIHDSA